MKIISISIILATLSGCSVELSTISQHQTGYKTACIGGVLYYKQGTMINSVVWQPDGTIKLCGDSNG